MEGLTMMMGVVAVISIVIAFWTNTKSGKRWIENL